MAEQKRNLSDLTATEWRSASKSDRKQGFDDGILETEKMCATRYV